MANYLITCPHCSQSFTANHNISSGTSSCPKCKKKWEDTSCPKCHKWSKHLLWYSDLDKLLKLELEKLNKVQENSFIELK